MPLISVIIPTYNCAEFLRDAIDSALNQSFTDIEVVVIDDGSTDNTGEIIRGYIDDARIKYICQKNSGLPGARNRGVLESSGTFVAALDADDTLAQNALEQMLQAITSSGASWCLSDITEFFGTVQKVQKTAIPKGDLLLAILQDDFIRRGMFFRKEALERVGMWDETMKMREDWDLNIRLISRGEPFVYVERPLYWYRRRPNSITTGNPERLFAFTESLMRKHHKVLADSGVPEVRQIYAQNMWDLGRRHFYLRRDLYNTLRCLTESMRYDFNMRRMLHPLVDVWSTSGRKN